VVEAKDEAARSIAELLLRDPGEFERTAKRLAKGDYSVDMPVMGNSMGAALADGTLIRVALAAGALCAPGDVVVFRGREEVVVHRALVRTRRCLITRGDARIAPDHPVPVDRVLGRVIGVVGPAGPQSVPVMHRRHLFVRFVDWSVIGLTVLTLRISPDLAARWIDLLTWIERRLPLALRIARHQASPSRNSRGAAAF
jgi:hypothetical protein